MVALENAQVIQLNFPKMPSILLFYDQNSEKAVIPEWFEYDIFKKKLNEHSFVIIFPCFS